MDEKIIFWIDSKLTYFGLAYYLQKKINAKFYAVIDITNKTKTFFQDQKLVNFEESWFFFDHIEQKNSKPDLEYLSNIEKKYGLKIWELALNERIFYKFNKFHKFTTDEILCILENECRLFEKILNDVKPTCLIIKETIQHKDHLFYQMCKKNGLKILMLSQPNFGYRCNISSIPHQFEIIPNLESIDGKNRSFEEIKKWINQFNAYKQQKELSNAFISSKSKKFFAAIQFFKSKNTNVKTHYTYFGRTKFNVLTYELSSTLKKIYREYFMEKNFVKTLDFNEKFVYFPLTVDEERNLLLGAPFYTNQVETIRHIVKSLPVDYKLYVKETPSQVVRKWRSISEYKEILSIPNVRLIHPSVSPEEIYAKTSLVMTISGTSGLEAAFHKIPSIIFSDVTYSILPSVHVIKSIRELPASIRESLKKSVEISDLDKYITFLEDNSFIFDQYGLDTIDHNHFFHGGHLVDVDIISSQMEFYLKENRSVFEKLSDEFKKKL